MPEGKANSSEPKNLLTAEELAAFLAHLQADWPQWFAMVLTQLVGALRFGEVSALRWADFDFVKNTIRVERAHWHNIIGATKTSRWKTVPMPPELKQAVEAWREYMEKQQLRHRGSELAFPSRSGKCHHNASCMRKAFMRCLEKADIGRRFSSHGLRRTANDLLRRVASSEVTGAITGHVTTDMTEHYSHVDAGEKRAAVDAMLRLVRVAALKQASEQALGGETRQK